MRERIYAFEKNKIRVVTSSQIQKKNDKTSKKSDFKILIRVIFITAMATYDHHTFRTVLKNNIFHVDSMKKGPTFSGSDFIVLGF